MQDFHLRLLSYRLHQCDARCNGLSVTYLIEVEDGPKDNGETNTFNWNTSNQVKSISEQLANQDLEDNKQDELKKVGKLNTSKFEVKC